jgi:hypothetical protein
MFLPAQLNCRSKLGAKLSSYYIWRVGGGGAHLFNAQAGRYLYKKWRCELGFNCTRWNMRKSCLVYLDTERYLRYRAIGYTYNREGKERQSPEESFQKLLWRKGRMVYG